MFQIAIWSAFENFGNSVQSWSISLSQTLSWRENPAEIHLPLLVLVILALACVVLLLVKIRFRAEAGPATESEVLGRSDVCKSHEVTACYPVAAAWRQFECGVNLGYVERAICVGPLGNQSRVVKLANNLTSFGIGVDVIDDLEEALGAVMSSPNQWYILIVDIDYCKLMIKIESVFSELALFRDNGAGITIILISDAFAGDHANLMRKRFADYTCQSIEIEEKIFGLIPKRRERYRQNDNVVPFMRKVDDVT